MYVDGSMRGSNAGLVAELFEEQSGICYLCGAGMDLSYTPGSITWASLDHKVPLSLGGTWDRSNLAVAHRGCNTWKRDARLEQLPDMRPGWPGTFVTPSSNPPTTGLPKTAYCSTVK
jgi:5-methylcytosine-specific restriction endonuclease McrA